MSTIWFTSDNHFGHSKIIEYSKRPFTTVEEMDEKMIENWNARVSPGDDVYHLGDFAFIREITEVGTLLKRLKGHLHLIRGNHDRRDIRNAKGFAEVLDYKELKTDDRRVILCHYPLLSWNGMHRGTWMLHGHCHGNLPKNMNARRIDIGVDPMGYKPVSLEEVGQMMASYGFAPVDHHGVMEE